MDDLRFTISSSVFQSYQEVGMAIVQGLIESVTESAVEKKLKKSVTSFYQRESCSANFVQQQNVVKLNPES